MKNVICMTCQKNYHDVYQENQAVGCSSDYIAKKRAIFCHYGSIYDTSKFNVVDGNFKEGNVCDTCIDIAIKNKNIILDEIFDYWEPIRKQQQSYKDVDWNNLDSS